jgi:hypothetical protein
VTFASGTYAACLLCENCGAEGGRMIRVRLATVLVAAMTASLVALWGVMPARGTVSAQWRVVVSGHAVPDFKAVAALSSRDTWAVRCSAL